MNTDDLTDKQRIFCHEYVIDWNATRAAKVAGYSEKTAGEMGYENLKKPQIKQYIEHIQKDLQKLAGVSQLSNIKKLLDIAENEDERASDKIKSIEVINKMLGYNEKDNEQKNTGSTDSKIEINFRRNKK